MRVPAAQLQKQVYSGGRATLQVTSSTLAPYTPSPGLCPGVYVHLSEPPWFPYLENGYNSIILIIIKRIFALCIP